MVPFEIVPIRELWFACPSEAHILKLSDSNSRFPATGSRATPRLHVDSPHQMSAQHRSDWGKRN